MSNIPDNLTGPLFEEVSDGASVEYSYNPELQKLDAELLALPESERELSVTLDRRAELFDKYIQGLRAESLDSREDCQRILMDVKDSDGKIVSRGLEHRLSVIEKIQRSPDRKRLGELPFAQVVEQRAGERARKEEFDRLRGTGEPPGERQRRADRQEAIVRNIKLNHLGWARWADKPENLQLLHGIYELYNERVMQLEHQAWQQSTQRAA